MHLNLYHIEKRRLPVLVTLVGGARLAGDVFVQAHARHHVGPEDAQDLLNSPEPFFPLALTAEETVMIAKSQVSDVAADLSTRDGEIWATAEPKVVEVTLSTGAVFTGSVFLAVPLERPRLLDYLNCYTEPFLTLYTTEGARLVNRCLIAFVRPLD